MRAEWAGRWAGAACAVAGCTPLLFAALAGTAGAVGTQGVQMGMAGGTAMTPGWVAALGAASWPLVLLSIGLLVWSLWRAPLLARALGYAGTALLLANQFYMRLWLFLPALLLVLAGFAAVLVRAGRPSQAPPAS